MSEDTGTAPPETAETDMEDDEGQAEGTTKSRLSAPQKMAVARAARAFATYGDAKKSMAKIAKSIVGLRLTFEKDGRPDYRGETPQYRGAIASLYEATIPSDTERHAFKVAIRYWVAKEFAARVKAGSIKAAELEKAGIGLPNEASQSTTAPRRAASEASGTPTGVKMDGRELSPSEVLVEAERMVAEHGANAVLGPVMTLQSLGRSLGPVVAALRVPSILERQPGRAIQSATEHVLTLSLDAASLTGVEVEEFVASWAAAHAEETSEVAA